MSYRCISCGKKTPVETRAPLCSCGGLFELEFSPPAWDPALIDRSTWNIFRYRAFMAVDGENWRGVTLGEGMTPIVEVSPGILVKVDYMMPTLSFKDRGAATLVSHMKAIGVERCVQDSSGNAGNSVAAYCARAGIACEIYVPQGTSPAKISMIEAHGAKCHVIPGTRDHCADVCRARVRDDGVYYANHVVNPYFYEGMKTYIYETFEQLGRLPAHILVPVGNGTLFNGIVKAVEHLHACGAIGSLPKIIALQSENCQPIKTAREQGLREPAAVAVSPTLAEGISIGVPLRGAEVLDQMARLDIDVVEAPEDRILEARARMARRGYYIEHTTAANFAAWDRWCEIHGPADDVLITLCGAGLKSDH